MGVPNSDCYVKDGKRPFKGKNKSHKNVHRVLSGHRSGKRASVGHGEPKMSSKKPRQLGPDEFCQGTRAKKLPNSGILFWREIRIQDV